MTPFQRFFSSLCVAGLLLCGPLALAQSLPGGGPAGEEPVAIEADQFSFDQQRGLYSATGGVRLKQGELTLQAEAVEWEAATGDARAQGGVRLEREADVMEGEAISINLETGLGTVSRGRAFLKERNFHLAGEEIERLGEQDYRLLNGSFTTCDGKRPAWKFAASRIDVSLGRLARARHVRFYLMDIPVLYLPYVAFPAKTERESGLLMPRFGYSDKRGTEVSLAYYQVLGQNMDATLYLDHLSDLGLGTGLEYRYIFGDDNEGTAKGYHITGVSGEADRYALDWQHQGTLPGRVRLTADAEYVSHNDYFDDFGEAAEEYNKDQAQTVITAGRHWGKGNLVGQVKYTKDLEGDNDLTLQRLPEVNYTLVRRRLGETPFFLRFDGTSTHFWRREGLKGERLDLRPSLAAVFHPLRGLAFEPEVGYRQRWYWTSHEGPGTAEEGIYDLSARLATTLSRVYPLGGERVSGVRHTLEPRLEYSYLPDDAQDHLPFFDSRDRIEGENRLTLSFINRFTARLEEGEGTPTYHEFLYLRLAQEFDVGEFRRDGEPGEPERPWGPARAEIILRPTRQSYLDLDASYDFNLGSEPVTDRFTAYHGRAGVKDGEGNGLRADYRFRRGLEEYVSGGVDLAWLAPVYVGYEQRYELDGGRDLEQVLNLEYRAQCWSILLTLRDRLDDRSFIVGFSLGGLGRVARVGGSFGGGSEE